MSEEPSVPEISHPSGDQRLALFLSEPGVTQTIGSRKLLDQANDYLNFLKTCAFSVKQLQLQKDLCLKDSVNGTKEEVQQLIIVVIVSESVEYRMETCLDFMIDQKLCQDRFLLFCRIRNPVQTSPDHHDDSLANNFSDTDFKYGSVMIAYKFDTADIIGKLLCELVDAKNSHWSSECVSDILYSDAVTIGMKVHRRKPGIRKFLRDIIERPTCSLQDESAQEVSVKPCVELSDEWKDRNAKLIYPNARAPKKPTVLIISNVNKGDKLCQSIQTDFERLCRLFKKLDYTVANAQTDSAEVLKHRVEVFTQYPDHGDSCVLVVLDQGNLKESQVVGMFENLANSEILRGKPRLFILNEFESTLQSDCDSDSVPTGISTLLADAIDSMQKYFSVQDSTIKVHPQSGVVFGFAKTADRAAEQGSPFIKKVCETFADYGGTEDVASMINLINEHPWPENNRPVWTIQTVKLFYITDTTGISTSHQVVSPQERQQEKKKNHLVKSNADKTGFAMILSEGSFDAARNYQTFLEYASFHVHFDFISGEMAALQKAIKSVQEYCTATLAIFVVLRKYRAGDDLNKLISIIKETREMPSEKVESVLLIFCQVAEPTLNGPQEPPNLETESLPEKFTVVNVYGTEEKVLKFLESMLDGPREPEGLNNSFVVGRDFSEANVNEDCFNMTVNIHDERPKWRKRIITWLGNLSAQDIGPSPDPQVSDDTRYVLRDEFRLEKARKEWHPCQTIHSPLPTHVRRALIVHNVVFKVEPFCTRFGSQHDCQRLTDCLMGLGFRVSIRSNLSKAEIEKQVQQFSDSDDHSSTAIIAFLSHGRLGEIIGSDGLSVDENEVLAKFSKGTGTREKQQLAIFQTCRISRKEAALPSIYPGMIIAHSTSPDDVSLRVANKGSRFIQSLCTVLDLFATKDDIVTLIPIVNFVMVNSIYDGFSQLPYWIVQTGKRLVLGEQDSPSPNAGIVVKEPGLVRTAEPRPPSDWAPVIDIMFGQRHH